jgi:hypothetical protein
MRRFCSDNRDQLCGLKIFVFGCAGTGKTTFGKIVEDHENMARLSGEYSLSAEMEMYGLEGKHFVQISIPPGQEAFRTRQWGQLLSALSDADNVHNLSHFQD